jgi:hypothetical protein
VRGIGTSRWGFLLRAETMQRRRGIVHRRHLGQWSGGWSGVRQRPGESEPRQCGALEAGEGTDLVAGEGEHEQACAVEEPVRGTDVGGECRLAVCAGGHEAVFAVRAEQQRPELGDDRLALVLERHRRHGHEDVVGK